mmetsp:Transcript_13042/g.33297  ORF Transcript_13042/g.33297 Transcript_13042/m.33297 type:complete len:234 (-) Transcript_13042:1216-1917(-)
MHTSGVIGSASSLLLKLRRERSRTGTRLCLFGELCGADGGHLLLDGHAGGDGVRRHDVTVPDGLLLAAAGLGIVVGGATDLQLVLVAEEIRAAAGEAREAGHDVVAAGQVALALSGLQLAHLLAGSRIQQLDAQVLLELLLGDHLSGDRTLQQSLCLGRLGRPLLLVGGHVVAAHLHLAVVLIVHVHVHVHVHIHVHVVITVTIVVFMLLGHGLRLERRQVLVFVQRQSGVHT